MKYHTHKWLFSKSTPQCFHMTTIMSKGVGVSFSRCPVVTSALLNKRERKLSPVESESLSGRLGTLFLFLPPLCCLLLWQWKHHWMTSPQWTLHIGTVWWQEQRKLQHRDGILSHHSTFIYTVLKDYYIYMPWYLHYTPRVCQTTWRYQDTRIFSYRDK